MINAKAMERIYQYARLFEDRPPITVEEALLRASLKGDRFVTMKLTEKDIQELRKQGYQVYLEGDLRDGVCTCHVDW